LSVTLGFMHGFRRCCVLFCWLNCFCILCYDLMMQRLELVLPPRKTIWDISMSWSLAQLSHLMKVVMNLTAWIYTLKFLMIC